MRTTFFFRERVSVMECLHLDKVPFQLNPVWSYYCSLNMTMFVFLITLSPLPFIPQPFPCFQLHFCTSRPVAEVKPRVSLPSLTTVSLSAPSARTPPLSGSVSPAEHSTVAGLSFWPCVAYHKLWPTILQMNTDMLLPMGWSTRRRQSRTLFAWRPMSSVSSAMTVMSSSSMTQLISKFSLLHRLILSQI